MEIIKRDYRYNGRYVRAKEANGLLNYALVSNFDRIKCETV